MQKTACLFILMFVTNACSPKDTPPSTEKKKETVSILAQYSDEEMHEFWNSHVNQVLMKQLIGNSYPLPRIEESYQKIWHAIFEKYGKPLAIEASTSYNQASRDVIAGIEVTKDGKPLVRIFVPAVMDKFHDDIARSEKAEQKLEVLVVVSFLHEAIHLLQKDAGLWHDDSMLITTEADAWATTCQFVLSVFIENGYTLDISDQFYWDDWTACEQQNNLCWNTAIANAYSRVLTSRSKSP